MREFEMTETDLAELMEASCQPQAIALNCGPPISAQARANAAWTKLGDRMGFDPMTVKPSRSGEPRFFYAHAARREGET